LDRCKFCSREISWAQIYGRWYPVERNGQRHQCTIKGSPTDLKDAVCMKCWLPLVSNREQCNCVSPVFTSKFGAKELRSRLERIDREKERAHRLAEVEREKAEKDLLKKARLIYRCVFCGSEAIQVEDSVICTKDVNHVFPSDYYGDK